MDRKVNTVFTQYNVNQEGWKQPFNKVTFCNYDSKHPVVINKALVIPKALTIGGVDYPTFLEISLNVGEVNSSTFTFDFAGSESANLVVIHTEYVD